MAPNSFGLRSEASDSLSHESQAGNFLLPVMVIWVTFSKSQYLQNLEKAIYWKWKVDGAISLFFIDYLDICRLAVSTSDSFPQW